MSKQHVVTSLAEAPNLERRRRMVIYSISMTVRFVCVALIVFSSGIWQWLFGIGAILLPYFAVVVANNIGGETKGTAEVNKVEPLKIDVASTIRDEH